MVEAHRSLARSIRHLSLKERLDRLSKADAGGCRIWQGRPNGEGYGHHFWKGKIHRAHRLSWEVANGRPVPPGMVICHKCDVPLCINPDHLFLGTDADNMADKMKKGRHRFFSGEDNRASRLTAEKVIAIRNDQRSVEKIGRDYGVSPSTIQAVRKRITWKDV